MKALIIGAGPAGRGLEGLELYRGGYDLVFADINPDVVEAIDTSHGYQVFIPETEETVPVKVAGAVDIRDKDRLSSLFQDRDLSLVVTAVGPDNLKTAAGYMAGPLDSITRRDEPLNVVACEGILRNTGLLKEFLEETWQRECKKDVKKAAESILGFPSSLVDRISLVGDDGIVRTEDSCEWLVDDGQWKGRQNVPGIKYVSRYVLEPLMVRKLYMLNGAHATIGFMGARKGIRYVHEAIRDEDIKWVVEGQLKEASGGLTAEYHFNPNEQREYTSRILQRFKKRSLGDTTERHRRGSPIRKLGKDDRFVGPALLALKHGIDSCYIALGAAYLIGYRDLGNSARTELSNYIVRHGIEGALKHYSGLSPEDEMHSRLIGFIKEALHHSLGI